MGEIKVNVGDPKGKKTHTFTISEGDSKNLHGKKLGDTFKGEFIERAGYELEITGGSDNAGFPMRMDVNGHGRRKLLVTHSTGNRNRRKGMRIRKTVAGNTIGENTSQINCKVVKYGKGPLVEEAKPEEPAAEEQKEEAPTENKAEAPKEETPKEEAKPEAEKKDDAPKKE